MVKPDFTPVPFFEAESDRLRIVRSGFRKGKVYADNRRNILHVARLKRIAYHGGVSGILSGYRDGSRKGRRNINWRSGRGNESSVNGLVASSTTLNPSLVVPALLSLIHLQ